MRERFHLSKWPVDRRYMPEIFQGYCLSDVIQGQYISHGIQVVYNPQDYSWLELHSDFVARCGILKLAFLGDGSS